MEPQWIMWSLSRLYERIKAGIKFIYSLIDGTAINTPWTQDSTDCCFIWIQEARVVFRLSSMGSVSKIALSSVAVVLWGRQFPHSSPFLPLSGSHVIFILITFWHGLTDLSASRNKPHPTPGTPAQAASHKLIQSHILTANMSFGKICYKKNH